MKATKELKRLHQENEELNKRYEELDKRSDEYREKWINSQKEVKSLELECSRLKSLNDILTQVLCEKYYKGSAIMYNEKDPRVVLAIKDGLVVTDGTDATRLSFSWYANEFPEIEVTK